MDLKELINEAVKEELNLKNLVSEVQPKQKKEVLEEGYAVEAKKFDLKTQLLSEKNKDSHFKLLDGYCKKLNEVSANLDAVDKSEANVNYSLFRSLKNDEAHNNNAVFLHTLFFENISDLNSQISTDSLTYMKLTKDFGTFENWQEDFIACGISSRNGWVVTGYNPYLGRYMNMVIDLHTDNLILGLIPVVVVDCWEHSYYRDYLTNREKYIHAMMKELDWEVIENRIEKCELISKAMRK